jgi:cyanophycin synthetase
MAHLMPFHTHVSQRSTATYRLATGLLHDLLSPARRSSRRQYASFYRELWTTAAAEVAANVRPLPDGSLEIVLKSGSVRVRNTYCSIDSWDIIHRARDKVQVERMLAEAGLPVPVHQVFTMAQPEAAHQFLAEADGPCVIKPARDTGLGMGVTTGVHTTGDLRRAIAAAAVAGARGSRQGRSGGPLRRVVGMLRALSTVPLLIERHVAGTNYRLLYIDGVLLDAIRREPPVLTGDGASTVSELIDVTNAQRLRAGGLHGQRLITRDLDLARTLAAQGVRPRTVLPAGSTIRLKSTINENSADGNHPALHEVCAEVVEQGRIAAETVGARLAGVDVITTDPSRPLASSGGRLLEVNTTPGLAMHHHGHPGQVAPAVALLHHLNSLVHVEAAR